MQSVILTFFLCSPWVIFSVSMNYLWYWKLLKTRQFRRSQKILCIKKYSQCHSEEIIIFWSNITRRNIPLFVTDYKIIFCDLRSWFVCVPCVKYKCFTSLLVTISLIKSESSVPHPAIAFINLVAKYFCLSLAHWTIMVKNYLSILEM